MPCARQVRATPSVPRSTGPMSERRAGNMRLLAAELRSTGEVRDDLSDDDIADLVWSLNSPEFFGLVASRGRDPQQYAVLVADVLVPHPARTTRLTRVRARRVVER